MTRCRVWVMGCSLPGQGFTPGEADIQRFVFKRVLQCSEFDGPFALGIGLF